MIPNILTTLRLFMVPLFAYLFIWADEPLWALFVFLLAGATDVIDGIIARKFNMITKIGKVYDPLADKLMQITTVLCLAYAKVIPSWVIWFIIFKEGTMIVGGIFLYARNVVVQSDWYGKCATVIFYAAIILVIVFKNMNMLIKNIILGIMVFALIFAAFGYLSKLLKAFGEKESKSLN